MKTMMMAGWLVLAGLTPFARAEQAAVSLAGAEVADAGNTVCPVSGDKSKADFTYDHEGKRYHFCCKSCIKDFKKDPEKYITKLEAEKSAGGGQGEMAEMGHEHGEHDHDMH